jgi:hypothetical protein
MCLNFWAHYSLDGYYSLVHDIEKNPIDWTTLRINCKSGNLNPTQTFKYRLTDKTPGILVLQKKSLNSDEIITHYVSNVYKYFTLSDSHRLILDSLNPLRNGANDYTPSVFMPLQYVMNQGY